METEQQRSDWTPVGHKAYRCGGPVVLVGLKSIEQVKTKQETKNRRGEIVEPRRWRRMLAKKYKEEL